jgi:hypothetical protein
VQDVEFEIEEKEKEHDTNPDHVSVDIGLAQAEKYVDCIKQDKSFGDCKDILAWPDNITAVSIPLEKLFCELQELKTNNICEATTFETSSNTNKNITNTRAHTFLLKCLERFKNAQYCAEIMRENNLDPAI